MTRNKLFLIIGHPRCGSGFGAYIFDLFGIKTIHERINLLPGKEYNSISSWALLIKHEDNDDFSLNMV